MGPLDFPAVGLLPMSSAFPSVLCPSWRQGSEFQKSVQHLQLLSVTSCWAPELAASLFPSPHPNKVNSEI